MKSIDMKQDNSELNEFLLKFADIILPFNSKPKQVTFKPEQIIYFGAPGTGKSHQIEEKLKEPLNKN